MKYPIIRSVLYDGFPIQLQVLSQELAKEVKHDVPYCVISITNFFKYNMPKLAKSPNRKDVLRLEFADVEDSIGFTCAMDDDQAHQVKSFVDKHVKMGVRLFVVHCTMGQSRSAGVAAGISKAINREDMLFFDYYRPNMNCYRKVLTAFCGDLVEIPEYKFAPFVQWDDINWGDI